MQHETPRRFDRPAKEDRLVERVVVVDFELVEHRADGHAADRVGDADPHRPFLIMADHRNHRMLEAGVANTGQREQQLAGEPGRGRLHRAIMNPRARQVQHL